MLRKVFLYRTFIAGTPNIREKIIDAGESAAPHVSDAADLNRCGSVGEDGQTIVLGMDAEFHEDIYLILPNEVCRVFIGACVNVSPNIRACAEFFRYRVFGCVGGVTENPESLLIVMRKQRQHQFPHRMTAKICRKIADAKPVVREPVYGKRGN